MDLGFRDEGYTVFQNGTITDVRYDKDGNKTETSLTEKEYRDMHPLHQDSGCKKCNFTPDLQSLMTYYIPWELKEGATFKPYCVGLFHMANWSGHSPFYLFKCRSCLTVVVDYAHGYTNGGCLYLRCSHCGYKLVLDPKKNKNIYQKENIPAPRQLSLLDLIAMFFKIRKLRTNLPKNPN